MWTDHLWGFHCYFNIIHVKAPALTDTAWAEGEEDVSIQALQEKEGKKKQGQKPNTRRRGLWQVSALTNPQSPPKKSRERERERGVPKCSFNCRTSIKASKWGRLGGTLAHQTDTPNTHHLYSGPVEKERSKFLQMKRGPFPAFIPPIHPLPLLLN